MGKAHIQTPVDTKLGEPVDIFSTEEKGICIRASSVNCNAKQSAGRAHWPTRPAPTLEMNMYMRCACVSLHGHNLGWCRRGLSRLQWPTCMARFGEASPRGKKSSANQGTFGSLWFVNGNNRSTHQRHSSIGLLAGFDCGVGWGGAVRCGAVRCGAQRGEWPRPRECAAGERKATNGRIYM